MGNEFDPAKESNLISYIDANNVYGWQCQTNIQTSGFKWMTDDERNDWKHLSVSLKLI